MTNSLISSTKTSRRGFLKTVSAAGGGFALGLHLPFISDAFAQEMKAGADEVNAWVVIKPDEQVIVRVARSEMGQGTMTGLAQLVAEELGCAWSNVKAEFPTPGTNLARKRVWGDMSTGGSSGIRRSQDYVRRGGAAARMMLLQAAANAWNVPVAELTVAEGIITHAPSNRTTTYGKMADAAGKLTPPDPKTITLKDPKTWTIAGKPLARLDTAPKLNGSQIYGIDMKLPGMLLASIKDCPVHGGKIASFDGAKAKAMPGVRHVLQVGAGAVAVVADTWWQANKALDVVDVKYEDSPSFKVSSASIAEILKAGLDATDNITPSTKIGDIDAGLAGAAKKLEAVYSTPYLAHVTMEPMNCTALWTPERCEVWMPSQNGEASHAAASEAAGLPPEKCDAHKLILGGGFGRRGQQDYVTKAVLIAKQIPGVPVKLIYSREEDMRQGRYRPVTQCKLKAGLDAAGNLVALSMRISGQSVVASVAPARLENGQDQGMFQGLYPAGPRAVEGGIGYTVPNLTIDYAMRNHHVLAGFWRGVNNNQNAIYLECFMDELAAAAGQDALEFRRKLMINHPRHLAVLNAAADKANWKGAKLPDGHFLGLAQMMGYGSYVAAVAEVSMLAPNRPKVHRVIMATDCGTMVNTDQINAQVVGSVAMGLSANLYEAITIKDGRVEQENLDIYNILKLAEFPKVEVVTVPSGGFWGGVGEPTIMVVAPAVLNAMAAATGKRIRATPIATAKV